jgi:serine/threonine protein kinase
MSKHDNLLKPGGKPRRFGDYLIHGLLGEGGMARIYDAREVLTGRRVALKVLRTEFAETDKGRKQFLTEMGILSNLDDPYIVRCHACVEIEQKPVMVLEQLDGWTLRQLLDTRKALPWTEVASIAYQITRALHAAHSHRPPIVHRDLKPDNVMYLRDGRVKVMDFGIAKVLQTLAGSTTQPFGTVQYMSPEHVDNRSVDGRADLFSLGVLMWEMLVGRPPFVSDVPRQLLDMICEQPAPRLPDRILQSLPRAFEQLIFKLLEKQPHDRPSSATEVLVALEPFLNNTTDSPTRRGTAPGTEPPHVPAHVPTGAPAPSHAIAVVRAPDAAPRKDPLQAQVEAQFDEVANVVSQFGRATSALIVRVLVGLMIYPAAAVVFFVIPALLVAINLLVLSEQPEAMLLESDFPTWVLPALAVAVPLTIIVFVRSCWAHHREPTPSALRNPWLGLGAILLVAWASMTAIDFGTPSRLDEPIHYVTIAAAAVWLSVTLSWATGRITSRILRRLEHAHD